MREPGYCTSQSTLSTLGASEADTPVRWSSPLKVSHSSGLPEALSSPSSTGAESPSLASAARDGMVSMRTTSIASTRREALGSSSEGLERPSLIVNHLV